MAGITSLSVKFEPEFKRIRAVFNRNGGQCEEIITFDQLEQLFADKQEGSQLSAQQQTDAENVAEYQHS